MMDRTCTVRQAKGAGLRETWMELGRSRPRLRQKDAADLLGVSEADLVESRCGHGVQRLEADWPALLRSLAALGPVRTITRNTHVVHETVGVYQHVSFVGDAALVQGEGLDLRLYLAEWSRGFLVRDVGPSGIRYSLQFYDAAGDAVHKIHSEGEVDLRTFTGLLSRFACAGDARSFPQASERRAPVAANGAKARGGDLDAMLEDWSRLEDTHDFPAMLARHGVARAEAMRLAEGIHTTALAADALGHVLESLSASEVPVMVFVGNRGAVQIRTGILKCVRRLGSWMNVLDPDFNLHVQEEGIGAIWAVHKPTRDGSVHSIELYARNGEEMAILYGARKPGRAEDPAWREALAGFGAKVAS